jgi:hypothetical protein
MFKKISLSTLLLLFGTLFVPGQTTTTTDDDYNKVEVFAGYSNNQVDIGISDDEDDFEDFFRDRKGFHGFNLSATGNFHRYVGVRGDFSAHFKEFDFETQTTTGTTTTTSRFDVDASVYNFTAGIQVKDNSKEGSRFRPFAYGMVGVARAKTKIDESFFTSSFCNQAGVDCDDISESETALSGVFGGGIDIRASRRVSVRAFQFDYNPTRFGGSTQNNFRFGVGLVFH